jgi:hypothetical protein
VKPRLMLLEHPDMSPFSTSAWSAPVKLPLMLLEGLSMSPASTSAGSSSAESLPRHLEHPRRNSYANRCRGATWMASRSFFEERSVVAIVGLVVNCCACSSRIAGGGSIPLGGLGGNPSRRLRDEDKRLSKVVLRIRM